MADTDRDEAALDEAVEAAARILFEFVMERDHRAAQWEECSPEQRDDWIGMVQRICSPVRADERAKIEAAIRTWAGQNMKRWTGVDSLIVHIRALNEAPDA